MEHTFALSKDQLEFLRNQVTSLAFAVTLFELKYSKYMDNYAKDHLNLIKNASKNILDCNIFK